MPEKQEKDKPDWKNYAYMADARERLKKLRSLETKYYLKIPEEIVALQAH